MAGVFFVLQFITPVGGGITGAFAAGWYCFKASTGIIAGISNGIACGTAGGIVGAGVSAFAVPIGVGVDIAISITLGGILVMALAWMGMFYPGTVLGAFLGESIPFLDVLPGWTLMVWRCLSKKKAEEKAAKTKEAPTAVSFSAPSQAFDGIRAANDNQQPYAQAA